jgi:hypothetical protein
MVPASAVALLYTQLEVCMTRRPGPKALLTALSCALATGMACAAEPAAPPAAQPATAAQAQARYVVRDAQTGQLRAPTDEELSAMLARQNTASRMAAPRATVVQKHPGGMRSAVLGTEHLVTIQAQRRANGTLDVSHTDATQAHPARPQPLPTE